MKIAALMLAAVVGAAGVVSAGPADAHKSVVARAAKHILLTAPADAVEGDRYTVAVRVPSPKTAATATLQYQKTADYTFESVASWTTFKSVKVHGHGTIKFAVQADAAREYRFRARVTYRRSKRASVSAATRVNYWHWKGLGSSYYSAGSGSVYIPFSIAGRSTNGWLQYSGSSAESRYTLTGRCRAFHASVGLADASADGSTGIITFSTIDSSGIPKPIWKSPTLVPGRTVPVSLSLASPYRFSMLGENTSTPVTTGTTSATPKAQPAVSDPEFLCHVD